MTNRSLHWKIRTCRRIYTYDTYVDAGLVEAAHRPQGQLVAGVVVGFLVGLIIGDLEDEARVAVATTTTASSCGPLMFVVVEEQP